MFESNLNLRMTSQQGPALGPPLDRVGEAPNPKPIVQPNSSEKQGAFRDDTNRKKKKNT